MNKVILFSPVGGTDPISETNLQDGSLLHICRFYHPDKVILYMSKHILEKHHEDNRYLYCLNRLYEKLNRTYEYEIIERKDLTDVQVFDYFYNEFKKILADIRNSMDESDTLIINISSGTPAMKSGLLVLYTIGEYNARSIQVITPTKRMNEHRHSENMNIEEIWECNVDNEPDAENRCVEVKCPTLENITKEKIIEQHLKAYDYAAAYSVASSMDSSITKEYINYIVAARERNELNYKKARNAFSKESAREIFPVVDDKYIKYFEYIQNLIIKFRRNEYADFIRAISPVILDLFIMLLHNKTGTDVRMYFTKKNNVDVWDENKLNCTDVDRILCAKDPDCHFYYNFIKSDQLCFLIDKMLSEHSVIQLVKTIRDVEQKVRNLAAHQIVSINGDFFKKTAGLSAEEMCHKLEELFSLSCVQLSSKAWDSYDRMNDFIIQKMRNNNS